MNYKTTGTVLFFLLISLLVPPVTHAPNQSTAGRWMLGVIAPPRTRQAPIITSADTAVFVVGETGLFTITTVGNPYPQLSFTGILPPAITLADNQDGTATLSGKPGLTSAGDYTITITAKNGIVPDATQIFTLRIIQFNSGIYNNFLPLFCQ